MKALIGSVAFFKYNETTANKETERGPVRRWAGGDGANKP